MEKTKTTLKKNKNGYGYLGLYKSPTYSSWNSMKQRCNNEKAPGYKNYGGRGITYDKNWEKFENFVNDMGTRPKNTTLDRLDVNGNYCKENCKWSTKLEQQHNLRVHKREDIGVTYDNNHKTHKWQVGIYFKDKKYATRFKTKKEAIEWRKRKEEELWQIQR